MSEQADARAFVAAALACDELNFRRAFSRLYFSSISLRRAFQLIARETEVPMAIRMHFLRTWYEHGAGWRHMIKDDRVLLSGLRSLLPPYSGPAVELFRGDSALNRRRRTYGPCWSRLRAAAETHATEGLHRLGDGGSVVLQTLAPAEAIICAVHEYFEGDDFVEEEYIVDRRRLGRVTVLGRYSRSYFT